MGKDIQKFIFETENLYEPVQIRIEELEIVAEMKYLYLIQV
jgi:hypothetical protein